MRPALLDGRFTPQERRWGRYMGTAMWFVSLSLLVALAVWSLEAG
jgi:hypothetical protein